MDRLDGIVRRVRAWMRRSAADRELSDELSFHIEMETERLMGEGLSESAAHRAAMIGMGGVDRFTEAARDERGARWLDDMRQDGRLALRLIGRNPQFTLATVLTLGLGIGANTAIFSVVDAVLLRPWPFDDVDRLMMIWETDRSSSTMHEPASWPDVIDMRERSRSFESIGSIMAMSRTLTGDAGAERVAILGVTANVPAVLGVHPILGRTFEPQDASVARDQPYRVMLSERFWRSRYGGRSDVAGTSLMIDGRAVEIIGVLPRHADLGIAQVHGRADYGPSLDDEIDMWLAMEPSPSSYPRETHPFLTLGRLRPGVTIAGAQAELSALMSELETMYPENAARGVNIESYEAVTFGPVRRALFVLLGGVALVLLVACVNVANLLLARTASRSREVAVRRALGASPARMRRQFLIESVVLAAAGAACGLILASISLDVLLALAPADIPRLADASLDRRVLVISVAVSLAVAIGFGMAPVLEARGLDLQRVLKSQQDRTATAGRDTRHHRSVLVVAQVALAAMLVVTAGLLVRSFQALVAVDPGFRTAGIVEATYMLTPASRYPTDFSRWPHLTEISTFHAAFLDRTRAQPGVDAATLASSSPLDPGYTNSFVIVGREDESRDFPEIRVRFITPGYLETLGVPLRAGRDFTHGDMAAGDRVGLINEAAVERYFGGSDAIDERISFWGVPWRVVGVIGNERFNGLDVAAEPAIYVPLAQAPSASVTVLARTSADGALAATAMRDILRDLDPGIALSDIRMLDAALDETVARPRFVAVLLSLFAGLALVLALIGVHGVLSYSVAQRMPEIGIRMALGATRGGIVALVLRDGALLAATGTIIGLALAAIVAQAMTTLLFGVTAHDALTFAVAAAAITALALVASLVPARHAARGEPVSALRSD